MRKLIIALACLLFTGCTLEVEDPAYAEGSVYVEIVYDECYEEPYWYMPEWCDYYSDGTECCVWYVDGWYEEWCQWDYDWCWYYEGSW